MNKKAFASVERVSSVETQNGKVFITVQNSRPGMERKIQYLTPFPGLMITPEQGDVVEVYDLDDSSTVAYLAHNQPIDAAKGNYDMPDLGQREIHLQVDQGTSLSFRSNGNGGYDLDINSSGTININADSISLGTNSQPLVTDVNTNSDGTVSSVDKTTKVQGE